MNTYVAGLQVGISVFACLWKHMLLNFKLINFNLCISVETHVVEFQGNMAVFGFIRKHMTLNYKLLCQRLQVKETYVVKLQTNMPMFVNPCG